MKVLINIENMHSLNCYECPKEKEKERDDKYG